MNILSSSRKNRATLILWLLESGMILLAGAIAIRLRFLHDPLAQETFILGTGAVRMVVVAAVLTTAMAAFGLYQVHMRRTRMDLLLRLVLSFAFGGIARLFLGLHLFGGILAAGLTRGIARVLPGLHLLGGILTAGLTGCSARLLPGLHLLS